MSILRKSELPEVIDLFSGCGGLALGFQQAGFKITYGIELMANAAHNASYNLGGAKNGKESHVCGDITDREKFKPEDIKKQIGPDGCIVIGGPPCQAYSMIGRAKLNSLREEGCFLDDKRGYLFEDFLRFAIGLDAKAVVMENVKQCTAYGKINVPEQAAARLEQHGYTVYWTILNSADYGVPQIRERMILFALKGDLEAVLPVPTHSGSLFGGLYSGNGIQEMKKYAHFKMPKNRRSKHPRWLTVEEAIGDLPELHTRPDAPYVSNSISSLFPYSTEAQNPYQTMMRKNTKNGVTGNSYRNTQRDFPIFARMAEGDNFVQAAELAEGILKDACNQLHCQAGSLEYEQLRKKVVPPYSTDKFLSKWKKLDRNKPSHTLVAHLSVDTYSHIHPWEPRGISVREAARLQSFPDNYFFQSTMGDAFKQIGNSVPPLLAEGIARAVKQALTRQEEKYGFHNRTEK